jgi:hypothetical protein
MKSNLQKMNGICTALENCIIKYIGKNKTIETFIWPSAIPNAKKYNELGVKNELSKDDLSRTDGYIQTAVC